MTANVVIPAFDEAPSTVVGGTPQSEFGFEFPFFASADIIVRVDGEALDPSDYSVEGLFVQNGDPVVGGYGSGTVTLNTPVSDCTVTIDRYVDGPRETQFSPASPIPTTTLNAEMNRLTARQQDVSRRVLAYQETLDTLTPESVEQVAEDRAAAEAAAAAAAATLAGAAVKANNLSDLTDAAAARSNIGAVGSAALAASSGAAAVGFSQGGTGARARTLQDRAREEVYANDFTGIDPTGDNDCYLALANAIAATPDGGTLHLNGYYRSSVALEITGGKKITIKGGSPAVTNVPNGATSRGFLFFYNGTDGIVVTSGTLLLSAVTISGDATTGGTRGVFVNGDDATLKMTDGSVVQAFTVGAHLYQSYYNKFDMCSIGFCDTCILADYCFNIESVGLTLRTNNGGTDKYGITLINDSSMRMTGGSIENFTGWGIGLFDGASVVCTGTYWEGSNGPCVEIDSGVGSVFTSIGSHVYLTTGPTHFVKVRSGAVEARIYSKANRLVVPESPSTATVTVYSPRNDDTRAWTEIAGDNWPSSPGSNVSYLGDGFFSGTGPVMLTGIHRIEYPANHPNAHKNVMTTPISASVTVSGVSGTPTVGMMVLNGCNGSSGDDPLSLRTANGGAWGANPYWSVWHKGRWEKMGCRIDEEANAASATYVAPAGGATVDTEGRASLAQLAADNAALRTTLNSLLTKLRAAGVMVAP